MKYISTRNVDFTLTAAEAIAAGLSPDGGLLTPEKLPRLEMGKLDVLRDMDYAGRAVEIMTLFLDGFSRQELENYSADAYGGGKFDHPAVAPVVSLKEGVHVLELWHGPTCAFKDMALQMLPRLLTASLKKTGESRTACILAATSGDTGKAALEGFRDVDGTNILVFYPEHGVSEMQKLQMVTQEGRNVGVCAVTGNFDDAQSGVKALFSDPEMKKELDRRGFFFSSANSINWGRVLPQLVYYISAYCDLVASGKVVPGEQVNICVPTGNFGNILAAYYAKEMGLPLRRLICASNANCVLTDFLTTGVYDRRRPFHATLSPSMDILISSNLERLLFSLTGQDGVQVGEWMAALNRDGWYEVNEKVREGLEWHFAAGFASDGEACACLGELFRQEGYLMDPHTAVAYKVLTDYRTRTGDATPTLLVSTASPFKFCPAVLSALGEDGGGESGVLLERLSAASGCSIPRPLFGISDKAIRFTGSVKKGDMASAVYQMLE